MIKKLQTAGIRVIACTPAAIGERTDFSNAQDGDLNRYSNIIRDLAKKYSCSLVDLRKAFLDYNLLHNLKNQESGVLTTDGVHLNEKGNQLLAQLMLPYL
jgi:lysophospholipase L1-like esterase